MTPIWKRLILCFFVAGTASGCENNTIELPIEEFSISSLKSDDVLKIDYRTSGHTSKRAKFVFSSYEVQVNGKYRFEIKPDEAKILDQYLKSVDGNNEAGRCSITIDLKMKVYRDGKVKGHKKLQDSWCLDDSKKISLSGILWASENDSEAPFWRSGEELSLVDDSKKGSE